MPVVAGDSQSTLPQAQASELAEDPSIERQSQYRAAMDPLMTPLNIPHLDAELSTHAGSQSGGWLKLFAVKNTEEGQRNQQAEGRRETGENNIVSYTKHATACCCKHGGHDWRPADKTLTPGHRRDFGHVPLIHSLVEIIC